MRHLGMSHEQTYHNTALQRPGTKAVQIDIVVQAGRKPLLARLRSSLELTKNSESRLGSLNQKTGLSISKCVIYYSKTLFEISALDSQTSNPSL